MQNQADVAASTNEEAKPQVLNNEINNETNTTILATPKSPKPLTKENSMVSVTAATSTISSHTELDNDNFEESKGLLKVEGKGIIGCLEKVCFVHYRVLIELFMHLGMF